MFATGAFCRCYSDLPAISSIARQNKIAPHNDEHLFDLLGFVNAFSGKFNTLGCTGTVSRI